MTTCHSGLGFSVQGLEPFRAHMLSCHNCDPCLDPLIIRAMIIVSKLCPQKELHSAHTLSPFCPRVPTRRNVSRDVRKI